VRPGHRQEKTLWAAVRVSPAESRQRLSGRLSAPRLVRGTRCGDMEGTPLVELEPSAESLQLTVPSSADSLAACPLQLNEQGEWSFKKSGRFRARCWIPNREICSGVTGPAGLEF
jgi:hypothetical protein